MARAEQTADAPPLADSGAKIVTRSSPYFATYRDAAGNLVTKTTGCRDEQAAKQVLAKWEREAEQIRAGTLDAKLLSVSRRASEPLEQHLTAYERSLVAAEVSDVYRANVLRAVRRLAQECRTTSLADFDRSAFEQWLAGRIDEGMSARTRNYYRESLIAFANWAVKNGCLTAHDFDLLPKADAKADPRRKRRALTEDELQRLLTVAVERPLAEARTVRRGKNRGHTVAKVSPEAVARLTTVGRERALIYKTLVLTGLRADESNAGSRPTRPIARDRPPATRRRRREEWGGECRRHPRRLGRRLAGVDRRHRAGRVGPAVRHVLGVPPDPGPRPERGWHPEAGRAGPDDRLARHADDVRDVDEQGRGPAPDGPKGDAALGPQADDGRLHGREVARQPVGGGQAAGHPAPEFRCRSGCRCLRRNGSKWVTASHRHDVRTDATC